MEQIRKHTKNRREKTIGFLYVLTLFGVATFICCWCISYYSDNKSNTRKEFAIAKMYRIRAFQEEQTKQMVVIDSIYNRIKDFNPGVHASYEENDIKFYLNEINKNYEDNSYDERYKVFSQVSRFYNMWFADKKELWSKQQNFQKFTKNLEDCEIGLQKKKEELKNIDK